LTCELTKTPGAGFKNFFGEDGFLEEFPDLIDLPHADAATREMRTTLREIHEDAMFSGERYRADLFFGQEDDLYKQAWSYEPEWKIQGREMKVREKEVNNAPTIEFGKGDLADALKSLSINSSASPGSKGMFQFGQSPSRAENTNTKEKESPSAFFTEQERRQLTLLSMRDFVEDESFARAHLKIMDVLLAFCYENRVGCGVFNVESHWTIRKLSATLSWLEDFSSMEQIHKSFARRCLTFPFLRRWDLTCKAAVDCAALLDDSRWMLRALLKVQQCLSQSQSAYLLNKLYVDDMCIFLQLKNESWKKHITAIKQGLLASFDVARKVPAKELVGWNLAKASSPRKIDAETLKTGHLLGCTPAKAPVFKADRNLIEELDF
jgi:hypothetical protein